MNFAEAAVFYRSSLFLCLILSSAQGWDSGAFNFASTEGRSAFALCTAGASSAICSMGVRSSMFSSAFSSASRADFVGAASLQLNERKDAPI